MYYIFLFFGMIEHDFMFCCFIVLVVYEQGDTDQVIRESDQAMVGSLYANGIKTFEIQRQLGQFVLCSSKSKRHN